MNKSLLLTLRQSCWDYYTHWKYMEEIRNETGFVMYGLNDERIRLHEELIKVSSLEREDLKFLTDNMFNAKSKMDFYNKVLQVVLEKTEEAKK